ncbi:MAG: aminopeptidase [Tannerellaceae bacterium]|jgi:hypothetical protein|nr:aminopeptidase [Tannerellaceae bacterium]
MRRRFFLYLLTALLLAPLALAGGLRDSIAALEGVSRVEELHTERYAGKYLVHITQPLDHSRPEAGSFTQRVVVCHAGTDRPTVIVTEGYGGNYAMLPHYQDEVSRLLDANVIFVEHRYFLESTPPPPAGWEYLTAANSASDLHRVTTAFKALYQGRWISTGVSKGGQTTLIYRAFFPDDVDLSIPYVAPLCRGVEDGRHEEFLRRVGTKAQRRRVENFQLEILRRKESMVARLEAFCREKGLTFRIPMAEVLDYCVLEYAFAFWQWGTHVNDIPSTADPDDEMLFNHLTDISGPDYFAENQPNAPFFVQAAKELGYYGYDTRPFSRYLTISGAGGYMEKLMLPDSAGTPAFDPSTYRRVYEFLRDNDPKIIYIYGELDPWSAVHAPVFRKKTNTRFFFQPLGSHRARIGNMPEKMRDTIVRLIRQWLDMP